MTSEDRLASWAALLALVTGQIDRHLRSQLEIVLAENRILCSQTSCRLRLDDEQRIALAKVGKPLGRSVLDHLSTIVTPIRDRDVKFTAGFDMIFKSVGIKAVKLPARSPNLNASAERFVLSIKSECTDRMIFFGEPRPRHAIDQYMIHYHAERPHQGIGNVIPIPADNTSPEQVESGIECRERLAGLLRFYHRKTAA
jgi:hypothetical protein